jgi:hypothetical protein
MFGGGIIMEKKEALRITLEGPKAQVLKVLHLNNLSVVAQKFEKLLTNTFEIMELPFEVSIKSKG